MSEHPVSSHSPTSSDSLASLKEGRVDGARDSLGAQAVAVMRDAISRHGPAVFTTSLGLEDMVLLDLIASASLPIEIVTLDTGRLPEATHAVLDAARARYRLPIRVFHPDAQALQAFTEAHGSNAFYQSIDLRKRCCAVRKLEPLGRALAGKGLWITGLRRAQSAMRGDMSMLAFDESNGLMKLNPLIEWSLQDAHNHARVHQVPVSTLHAQGYPSIGCSPCTRAVQPGEDERAGRWWWESAETRECGLHRAPDGRLVRAVSVERRTSGDRS